MIYTLKYQPHHCKCIVTHCNARILIEHPFDGIISREPSSSKSRTSMEDFEETIEGAP
jgi:hypothetical protein